MPVPRDGRAAQLANGVRAASLTWVERAEGRSPTVKNSRTRSARQARSIVDATYRVLNANGGHFTVNDVAREAGVALQTLYAYFGGRDELMMAVFEDMILNETRRYQEACEAIEDPVDRLYLGITAALDRRRPGELAIEQRFLTSEYWRLCELFPHEMAAATEPFARNAERHLRDAADRGSLHPNDPERDAWLITKLVLGVYHDQVFSPPGSSAADVGRALWAFCYTAVGGRDPARLRPGGKDV